MCGIAQKKEHKKRQKLFLPFFAEYCCRVSAITTTLSFSPLDSIYYISLYMYYLISLCSAQLLLEHCRGSADRQTGGRLQRGGRRGHLRRARHISYVEWRRSNLPATNQICRLLPANFRIGGTSEPPARSAHRSDGCGNRSSGRMPLPHSDAAAACPKIQYNRLQVWTNIVTRKVILSKRSISPSRALLEFSDILCNHWNGLGLNGGETDLYWAWLQRRGMYHNGESVYMYSWS